jgi:hypothetical protein
LRTLDDVRMFMLDNLPEEDQARRPWQKACEILLAAADGLADVRAATRQVELALFQRLAPSKAARVGSTAIRRPRADALPDGTRCSCDASCVGSRAP